MPSLKSLMTRMMIKEFKAHKIQLIFKILKIRMKKFQTSSYEFSIPRQVSRQIFQDLFRQEQEILDRIL